MNKSANARRDFEGAHSRVKQDYFWPKTRIRPDGSCQLRTVYLDRQFEHRFWMPKKLFDRLFTAVVEQSDYFRKDIRPNYSGCFDISPLLKVVCALRQIAYSVPADATDEYCEVSETAHF